ncbi:MAG: FtsB family cell division protein [Clostridia bacterium]|nr:septum formation initiator family protein [Clostridium sp.]MBS6252151.1 septum formation initiator family protein [Clostridium sp.]
MKKNKIIRNIIIFIILIYVIFTLINQQKILNQYSESTQELAQSVEEEKQNRDELTKKKEDVNSLEFIEEMAREKLDMYHPNEKVFIDQGK